MGRIYKHYRRLWGTVLLLPARQQFGTCLLRSDISVASYLHLRLNLDIEGLLLDSFHLDLHGCVRNASTVNVYEVVMI